MKINILKSNWILILFVVLPLSKILAQHCYIYEGQKWVVNSVTFHINGNLGDAFATQEEYETAIIAAAASWNDAGANFEFIRDPLNVYYDRGEEPSYIFQVGKFYEAGGPLGLTDIFINTSDEIIKAETYVNKYYWFTIDPNSTEYDIQSHVLHEFGHWLRLLSEEDFGCIENVMYKYLFQGEVKRNLTQDDKNGIVYIYGQNPIIQLTINPLKDRQKYFFEYGPEVLSYILENIEKNKILESINKEGE